MRVAKVDLVARFVVSANGSVATPKQPFDINIALDLIREAVAPFPKAALFELYDDGHISVFEQLLACIISIRTRDETTLPVSRSLFERARTPAQVHELAVADIDGIISRSAFHATKAAQISEIARIALERFGGALPCKYDVLVALPGVGAKCANLALGVACGQARIGVDIHVHRITNRWGYVNTSSPSATLTALEERLPAAYAVEINRLLVPFGKHICVGVQPLCSRCPVLEMCEQVEVHRSR